MEPTFPQGRIVSDLLLVESRVMKLLILPLVRSKSTL
jgi:hypothetical protein